MIALVDAGAMSAGAFAAPPLGSKHENPLQEVFDDQLASADLVILNKSDLVDAGERAGLETRLRARVAAAGLRLVTVVHPSAVVSPAAVLGEGTVVLMHGARNAMIPVVTVIGAELGQLVGAAVLTESIFAIPGLGDMLLNAALARDYPLVQAGVFVITLVVALVAGTFGGWLTVTEIFVAMTLVGIATSFESPAGIQYWRISVPMGVPGPTRASNSVSFVESIVSPSLLPAAAAAAS